MSTESSQQKEVKVNVFRETKWQWGISLAVSLLIAIMELAGPGVMTIFTDKSTEHPPSPVSPPASNPEELFLRGKNYREGNGGVIDFIKARENFEEAAKGGHTEAQFWLGWMITRQEGGPRNVTEARRWLRLSSDKGHDKAMVVLGELEEDAGNLYKALNLYKRAADFGNPHGMYHLSRFHLEGKVGKVDEVAATNWLKQAAVLGHEDSRALLRLWGESW